MAFGSILFYCAYSYTYTYISFTYSGNAGNIVFDNFGTVYNPLYKMYVDGTIASNHKLFAKYIYIYILSIYIS